jgi:hypothetical protein
MSEHINAEYQAENFRRNLLMNVSALALLGYLGVSASAQAAEDGAPVVWIELGGQLEQMSNAPEIFTAPFFAQGPSIDRETMVNAQSALRYSIGGESKITFQPDASDWIFSATVRYGRANGAAHRHHQTPLILPHTSLYISSLKAHVGTVRSAFADAQTKSDESHLVLDFQAGKDVGLGLFGGGGTSVVSAGVRYAQFSSRSDAVIHARPLATYEFVTHPGKYRWFNYAHHTYTAVFHAKRSTHAIGPSLSWDASAPVAGNRSSMTLNFDWGANAAVLFGRQRAHVAHGTTGYSLSATGGLHRLLYSIPPHVHHYTHPLATHDRARTITIPNVGGFAGVSLHFPNAKVALGYRADFFFGAMDNGIDTAKRENVGFYGPFATISVGLGG